MSLKIITREVEFNITPLEDISINTTSINIYFDDINEKRWKLTFCPFQAVKIVTVDCANPKMFLLNGTWQRFIIEMLDSNWIRELKSTLSQNDEGADFMEKAHHFILPFQDNIIEVVAWDNFSLEMIN